MSDKVRSHTQLRVYKRAVDAAMEIFGLTKQMPKDENFSLIDQIRRSSRSVCANLAEGWRKRRYQASFQAKLIDAEGEAAETQVWLELAVKCGYLDRDLAATLYREYDSILATLVGMRIHSAKWTVGQQRGKPPRQS